MRAPCVREWQVEVKTTSPFVLRMSAARRAIFSAKFGYFPILLAGKICVWRVADFLAIVEMFRREIWWIFVQDLD